MTTVEDAPAIVEAPERKIAILPEWLDILDEYMMQRHPRREIFDCTARNLEYVLRDIATQTGVSNRKMSFEALRWTRPGP